MIRLFDRHPWLITTTFFAAIVVGVQVAYALGVGDMCGCTPALP